MFALRLDVSKAEILLDYLREKAYKTRPILSKLGDIMLKGVDRNFQEQGRPEAWKPLKDITLLLRKNFVTGRGRPRLGTVTGNFGDRILERTKTLRRSIGMKLYPNRVEIGTNVPYAALHEEGGTIINHIGKSAYVDARPFMHVTDREVDEMVNLVENYMFDETNLRKG